MWSYARLTLGMSQAEYFRLSPRQFSALVDRAEGNYKRSDLKQEYMLAQIASTIANFGFRTQAKWQQPRDFMPSQAADDSKKKKVKKRRRSHEAIAQEARAIFDFLRKK